MLTFEITLEKPSFDAHAQVTSVKLRLRNLPKWPGQSAAPRQRPTASPGSREGRRRGWSWADVVHIPCVALNKIINYWRIWAIPYNTPQAQCLINGNTTQKSVWTSPTGPRAPRATGGQRD